MAHGGTNFGMWSGANGDQTSEGAMSFKPYVTSYDYSAPISEAGDHNLGSDGGGTRALPTSPAQLRWPMPLWRARLRLKGAMARASPHALLRVVTQTSITVTVTVTANTWQPRDASSHRPL